MPVRKTLRHGTGVKLGVPVRTRYFRSCPWTGGGGVEWILKLAAAGDEGPRVDIMEISKPDALGDIANLGLTLTEAKQLLARVQREIWFCRKVRFVAEVGTNERVIFSGLVFGRRNRKPTLRQNPRTRWSCNPVSVRFPSASIRPTVPPSIRLRCCRPH
jgi:hypothetical protein